MAHLPERGGAMTTPSMRLSLLALSCTLAGALLGACKDQRDPVKPTVQTTPAATTHAG
jgi:hypothetical protein